MRSVKNTNRIRRVRKNVVSERQRLFSRLEEMERELRRIKRLLYSDTSSENEIQSLTIPKELGDVIESVEVEKTGDGKVFYINGEPVVEIQFSRSSRFFTETKVEGETIKTDGQHQVIIDKEILKGIQLENYKEIENGVKKAYELAVKFLESGLKDIDQFLKENGIKKVSEPSTSYNSRIYRNRRSRLYSDESVDDNKLKSKLAKYIKLSKAGAQAGWFTVVMSGFFVIFKFMYHLLVGKVFLPASVAALKLISLIASAAGIATGVSVVVLAVIIFVMMYHTDGTVVERFKKVTSSILKAADPRNWGK